MSLDNTLTSLISKHRMRPSHTSVESVIALTMIFNNRNIVTAKSGILSPIFVNYVKDVLQLLKVIIFVSECNIEMVSKAERALLPKFTTFAYSNFSSSQVCFLGSLSNWNTSVWKDLVGKKWFRKHLKRIKFHRYKIFCKFHKSDKNLLNF